MLKAVIEIRQKQLIHEWRDGCLHGTRTSGAHPPTLKNQRPKPPQDFHLIRKVYFESCQEHTHLAKYPATQWKTKDDDKFLQLCPSLEPHISDLLLFLLQLTHTERERARACQERTHTSHPEEISTFPVLFSPLLSRPPSVLPTSLTCCLQAVSLPPSIPLFYLVYNRFVFWQLTRWCFLYTAEGNNNQRPEPVKHHFLKGKYAWLQWIA